MKIHLIEESWGSYDDYGSWIKHAFLKQENAKKYVDDYNEELRKKCEKYQECEGCFYNTSHDKEDISEKTQAELQGDALRLCSQANVVIGISDDEDEVYYCCKNAVDYYSSEDRHSAQIEVIEIDDWSEDEKSTSFH